MENTTEVTQFILLGLANTKKLQVPLFLTFVLIYVISVVGNMGIVLWVLLESHLRAPMYFFLSNLSLVDFGYSTAVIPTVLAGFLTGGGVISYNACAAQMFFLAAFATVENFPLAAMACDRYAAVCRPLHYTATVATSACASPSTGPWVCGLLNASVHAGIAFSLSLCGSSVVHRSFCDVPAVTVLSCSDRYVGEMVLVYVASFNVFFALLVILISYIFICTTILKMHSSAGHQKALSTCACPLTAVSVFHGTVITMHLQPSSSHSMDTDKIVAVFYTMVIPTLNPLVYSLRNKEVKSAFKKMIAKARLSF